MLFPFQVIQKLLRYFYCFFFLFTFSCRRLFKGKAGPHGEVWRKGVHLLQQATLVDLLNLGALIRSGIGSSAAGSGTWHTTGHTTRSATSCCRVNLLHDWVGDSLNFLLLGLVLLFLRLLVVVEPLDGLLDLVGQGLLVRLVDLSGKLLVVDGVLQGEAVVLQAVLGHDLGRVGLVLSLELLGLLDHALDLLLAETALVVGDRDLVLLASRFLYGGHVKDTIGIDIVRNLNLGHTAGHGWDAVEVELSKEVVVPSHGALSLVHLDQHTGLVVGVGGESLRLLGGYSRVALDEGSHNTTCSLNTERERSHIEQEEIVEVGRLHTTEDGSLHGGTVGDGLVRVDGLARVLAIEELLQHLLDLRDTGGSSNEYELINLVLRALRVAKGLLNRGHALAEVVHVELFEAGTGDGRGEVVSLVEGVDLDVGLG